MNDNGFLKSEYCNGNLYLDISSVYQLDPFSVKRLSNKRLILENEATDLTYYMLITKTVFDIKREK